MLKALSTPIEFLKHFSKTNRCSWIILFASGMLLTLGFAPFHLPGAAILALSLFYTQIQNSRPRKAFFQGLALGLGMFGLGVSWVSISIHTYGHLALIWSYLVTSIFVLYLALFPALCSLIFRFLTFPGLSLFGKTVLFSSLWCLTEYLRANFLTGFPWLLLGFGQIDTPLQYLLPITGLYGLSFFAILAAAWLSQAVQKNQSSFWLLGFTLVLITPAGIKHQSWTELSKTPLSVGVIQANLSMRDKWDETVFWSILEHYQQNIQTLIGKKQIIVLPESAIPLPSSYIPEWLLDLNHQAKKQGSAILFGIPEEIRLSSEDSTPHPETFYNSLASIGVASGIYHKQHLVPFGEYVPAIFNSILARLNLVMSNMQAGQTNQPLVSALGHSFASLICYELAYPQLLRQQLPTAQWIVSISDDGWFGHSLASYQHLQMAQALSIMSGRFQIVANNDGLSSIINPEGRFVQSLPAFTTGILEGNIYPAQGATPWTLWGDAPILSLALVFVLYSLIKQLQHKKMPRHTD